MASNKDAVVDGYGDASDWVEIFNAGDESVDLQGFRLTDDAEELDKWEFPSVELAPGEYLVVFASSRDVVDPAGHLHTNFGLSVSGEYLALVNPLGEVLSEFGSSQQDYPPHDANASFGLAFDTVTQDAITAQSATKYLVPTASSVDSSWMLPQFDDAAWADGTARLGYEASPGAYASLIQTPLPAGTKSVYVRIPFNVSDASSVVGALRMKYDDGFVAYLNGVEVARSNAPGALSYDASATSFRPREAAILEQAFNISSYSHLLQVGENVLAIHVLDSSSSPTQDLLAAPTLTVATGSPILPLTAGRMVAPTPGAANSQVVASDVVFSRGGGVITGPIDLQLSGAVAGEVIRYTTDGSVPTENSPIYETPISISSSKHVRARIFGPNGQIGAVRSEAFTLASAAVAEFSSELPIIVLENFGAGLPGGEFTDAMFALYEANEVTGRTSFADSPTLTSIVGHHRRGSSTYDQPKLNLRVEFRDENGHDVDVEMLGMPGESDWILYAPYTTDHSMLRNVVMYDLSGQVVDYAVRTRYVEVFFNSNGSTLSSDEYMGVYVLMETIKLDENRVVSEEIVNDEGEMPGGYILKIDRTDWDEDASWDTAGTPGVTQLVHVDPKRLDMSQANVDYIRNYIAQFEAALYGSNWTDPELGYAAYIDVDS